nr:NADH dehydrogenase subunit 6 [Euapta godeffroyi]
MSVVLSLLGLCGVTMTAYSLSPYFGALGLVLVSFSICCFLSVYGFSFLGLVLLLTYLGGMLVVFIYSSALTLDRYPDVGSLWGFVVSLTFFLFVLNYNALEGYLGYLGFFGNLNFSLLESEDWRSVGTLYYDVFGLVFIVALSLLVVLVMVLVVTFGCYKNSLRSL